MTRQHALDVNWQTYVIEKKPPATDRYGTGVYLNSAGGRCAIGLLIPPATIRAQRLHEIYEHVDVPLVRGLPCIQALIKDLGFDFVYDLQMRFEEAVLWDQPDTPSRFTRLMLASLLRLARTWKLKAPCRPPASPAPDTAKSFEHSAIGI